MDITSCVNSSLLSVFLRNPVYNSSTISQLSFPPYKRGGQPIVLLNRLRNITRLHTANISEREISLKFKGYIKLSTFACNLLIRCLASKKEKVLSDAELVNNRMCACIFFHRFIFFYIKSPS